LALVLGPQMETNLRRALTIARGDYTTFVASPISAALLLGAVLSLTWPLLVRLAGRKRPVLLPTAEEV
jgi:putative tricarboxylic transport membrane protein